MHYLFRVLLLSLSGLILVSCSNISDSPGTQWKSELLRDHPLTGKIFDLKNSRFISYRQLTEQLRTAQFVLIGEKHDNPDHHLIEQQLLHDLNRGMSTRVVLEMLNQEQASGSNRLTPEDTDAQMQTKLSWAEKGWPWQDYGDLIRIAVKGNNEILGGNISRAVMMDIYRGNPPLQPRFDSVAGIAPEVTESITEQVYQSHCETIPRSQLQPMTRIQLSRDASMAWQMSSQLKPDQQSILFTGAFHARKDTGVPLHLKRESTTLILAEADNEIFTIQEHPFADAEIADYIWFTPRFSAKDYCAELREKSH